jgi:hypothetical protein
VSPCCIDLKVKASSILTLYYHKPVLQKDVFDSIRIIYKELDIKNSIRFLLNLIFNKHDSSTRENPLAARMLSLFVKGFQFKFY